MIEAADVQIVDAELPDLLLIQVAENQAHQPGQLTLILLERLNQGSSSPHSWVLLLISVLCHQRSLLIILLKLTSSLHARYQVVSFSSPAVDSKLGLICFRTPHHWLLAFSTLHPRSPPSVQVSVHTINIMHHRVVILLLWIGLIRISPKSHMISRGMHLIGLYLLLFILGSTLHGVNGMMKSRPQLVLIIFRAIVN